MIDQEQIEKLAALISTQPLSESLLPALRGHFPDLHFSYCMDEDAVGADPVYEAEYFNLYLVDGRHHCLCLTRDFEAATGILVAEI